MLHCVHMEEVYKVCCEKNAIYFCNTIGSGTTTTGY